MNLRTALLSIVVLTALAPLGASTAEPSPRLADVPTPRTDENSKIAHRDLVAKARHGAAKGRIDVYFIGDSITRRWGCTDPQYRELLEHWKKTFFGWNAANFGWGGDETGHILWRLQNGELDGLRPRVFVVLAGTNNIGAQAPDKADPDDIARGIEAIVGACRKHAPDAKIVLTAIFPRNDNREALPIVRQVNQRIAALADGKRVRFLDVSDKLAHPDGTLREGMMADGLHPTLKGYEVWADGLRPILTEWLGPPAGVDLAPPPTGDPSATRPRLDASR